MFIVSNLRDFFVLSIDTKPETLGDSGICTDDTKEASLCSNAEDSSQIKDTQQSKLPDDKECQDFDESMVKTSSPTSGNSDSPKLHFKLDHNKTLSSDTQADSISAIEAISKNIADVKLEEAACVKKVEECKLHNDGSVIKKGLTQRSKFHSPPKSIFSPVVEV